MHISHTMYHSSTREHPGSNLSNLKGGSARSRIFLVIVDNISLFAFAFGWQENMTLPKNNSFVLSVIHLQGK